MSDRLAFLDLDGVIADDRHRVQHAVNREWGMYFGLMDGDAVWQQGRELYENCHLLGFDVAYLTGRREDTRRVTQAWLRRHGFDHRLPLIMRKQEDRRPLGVVKAAVVAEAVAFGYEQVFMYDDDPTVIELTGIVPGGVARHCAWYTKPAKMIKRGQT